MKFIVTLGLLLLIAPFATAQTVVGSGTNANEPAQYNLGSSAEILQGADGTSTSSVTPTKPGINFQFFRKNASWLGVQMGCYQTAVDNADRDIYCLYPYTSFSADLTNSSNRTYNIHGIRSEVVIAPTNVGTNMPFGWNWFRTQKYSLHSYGVGLQLEANNLSGVDDYKDPIQGLPASASLLFGGGGNAHASSDIHSQPGNGAVDARYNGWSMQPNTYVRYVIDAHRATFNLQGAITFTSNSSTITGSGTKFVGELHQGDTVIAGSVPYTIAADPAADGTATLTKPYAASTETFSNVLKPVTPLRMPAESCITASTFDALTNPTIETQFRLICPHQDQVSIDPDAKGTVFGGMVGVGMVPSYRFEVLGTNANPSLYTVGGSLAINGGLNTNQLVMGSYPSSPFGVWLQAKDNSSGTGSGTAYPMALNPLGGNVGIGTSSPGTRLEVVGGDVAVSSQGYGIILRATDGSNCFRVTVNNAGSLTASVVACP